MNLLDHGVVDTLGSFRAISRRPLRPEWEVQFCALHSVPGGFINGMRSCDWRLRA
jgi:hypothetical protein